MGKCSWCQKEVSGEIRSTPAYHPECKESYNQFQYSKAQLVLRLNRFQTLAELIHTNAEGALAQADALLDVSRGFLDACLKLKATRP